MRYLNRALNSVTLLYAVLLWPSRDVVIGLFDDTYYYGWMMDQSGVWAIYMLILTLSVTPALLLMARLKRGAGLGRWLLQRRRHFGLASFIYAALHLVHYILETQNLSVIVGEALALKFAVGWLAFVIFTALAVTSSRAAARRLGRRWKALHRWVYVAAACSALHWYLFDYATSRVVFWVGLLALTKLVHWGVLRWRDQTMAVMSRV